jgi:tetratricopeptide (TPR) repeat protein
VYGVSIGEQGADVTSLLQKEREAIDAAIALDPQLPEARMRAARHYFRMGDLVRASSEMAIARELAPEDPAVLSSSVERIARAGRLDEAIDVQRRVVAADPLSRVARVNLANYLLAAGRLDEARTEFLNFVAMGARPDPEVAVDLARIDLFAGRYREAMVEAELWPSGPDRDFVLAVAGDGLRKHEVAREAEARLLAGTAPAQAVRLAELYAHRNDANQAFRWMNVAYDRLGRDPWLTDQWEWVYHLSLSPFLKPLRADARWAPTAKRGEPRSRAP